MVELAFAGLIAAGLSIVALELLLTSVDVKLQLDSQLRVNQAARQSMTVIADGGGDAHGTRGRAGPAPITLADGEVLQLDSNGLTVTGDRTSSVDIVCAGAGDPVPACVNAGDALTLDGPIAGDPAFQDVARSVFGRTVETEIRIRDPWAAARGHGRTERYGGIHIYNAQEGEGVAGAAGDTVGGGG